MARRWLGVGTGLAIGIGLVIACSDLDGLRVLEDPPVETPEPEEVLVEEPEVEVAEPRPLPEEAMLEPPTLPAPKPIALPEAPHWQFYGPQHGGPRQPLSVSTDQGGNLWVAGGDEGLFVLRPGEEQFQRFTIADGLAGYTDASGPRAYKVLSVAGGKAGTVYVGYKGLHGGLDDGDPEFMRKSGDADEVTLAGAGITVRHFDISTPPGSSSSYPDGREKIRDVLRIIWNAETGDVWFGGNHGVALWDAVRGEIREHKHAAVNGYTSTGHHTMLSGDWYGIALDANGDFWLGGGHRTARIPFSHGRGFSSGLDPELDIWPDAKANNARPDERIDDFIQDMAAMPDGSVWVGSIPNGLARITPPATISTVSEGMVDKKVTALETDRDDGSLWVGHIWGGLSRLKDGAFVHYDFRVLGDVITRGSVPDIQSDVIGGRRRILVAFDAGAIGIYTGP